MSQKLKGYPYILAMGSVAIAFVFHSLVVNSLGSLSPYLFFLAAISFVSWMGGLGPGILASGLSVLVADHFATGPFGTFAEKSLPDLASMILFFVVGCFNAALFHSLYRTIHTKERTLEQTEIERDRAEEANEMKRSFIANMSHEIRAPLSAVLGYSELLAQDNVRKVEREEYLNRLKVNAASLTQLVSDLLDVTEINATYFIANRKRMSLASFVQTVYETFAPLAMEKGLKFQVQLRGSAPTYVESDPEHLMQILRQIIGNAIRYADRGTIKLTVTTSRSSRGHREVALIVNDEGHGIPNEIKKKLFKPFRPVSDDSGRQHGGTGMGLTLARRLARGLGGDVKLAKSDRHGSTFLVTFDAGPADELNEFFEALGVATKKPSVSLDDPNALKGIRVLMIDDSPDSSFLVTRILKQSGADTDTAYRAQDGIDQAVRGQYDVVLMDTQMPGMDGNEATRRLRTQGYRKPIIALSAHAMREDREEAERSGADDYLPKPVSRRSLLQMIRRYAQASRSGLDPRISQLNPHPMH